MGSTNPNKYLPPQWFQAARRQFMKTQRNSNVDYESKLPVTSSTPHDIQDHHPPPHAQNSTSYVGSSSIAFENGPTTSRSSESSPSQSQTYFRRSQKYFSKKFFQSNPSQENKPYCSSKVFLHTSSHSDNSDIHKIDLTNPYNSMELPPNETDQDFVIKSGTYENPTNYVNEEFSKATGSVPMARNKTPQFFESMNEDNVLEHNNMQLTGLTASTIDPVAFDKFNTEYLQKDEVHGSNSQRTFSRRVDSRLHRTWVQSHATNRSHKFSNVVGTCSIMSYNILSQTLLEDNSFLYEDCNQDALPWLFRWNNLKRELEGYNIDVLCLQEVEEEHYHDVIKPWLDEHKYIYSYKRRTGLDKPDGVLTACLSKKYEIVSTVPVEYFRPSMHNLTDWHNVGLIVVVKMRGKSSQDTPFICVANTHLVYNPKRGDVKLTQLATFLAEIDKVLKEYLVKAGYQLPLIMCGDFNSTPYSPIYNLITNGWLHYRGLSSRHVSGQRTRGGGRDLPDYLLPLDLRVDESCTFMPDGESGQPRQNHIIRHNLGPLASSCDRHKRNEATTTQDRGITVDYIFYSNAEKPHHTFDDQTVKTDTTERSAPTDISSANCSTSTDNLDPNCSNPSNNYDQGYRSSMSGSDRRDESRTQDLNAPAKIQPRKYALKLYKRLSLCSGYSIYRANGLPNKFHSSDHLPVLAKFCIVDSTKPSSSQQS